jgi:hypothetical protein
VVARGARAPTTNIISGRCVLFVIARSASHEAIQRGASRNRFAIGRDGAAAQFRSLRRDAFGAAAHCGAGAGSKRVFAPRRLFSDAAAADQFRSSLCERCQSVAAVRHFRRHAGRACGGAVSEAMAKLFPGAAQHPKRVHARLARAMVMRCRPGIAANSENATIPDQRRTVSRRAASGIQILGTASSPPRAPA